MILCFRSKKAHAHTITDRTLSAGKSRSLHGGLPLPCVTHTRLKPTSTHERLGILKEREEELLLLGAPTTDFAALQLPKDRVR